MTRYNCDRCGVEISGPTYSKGEEFIGTMKYRMDSVALFPTVTAFDLCQPCKAWIIKEATTYKGGHK